MGTRAGEGGLVWAARTADWKSGRLAQQTCPVLLLLLLNLSGLVWAERTAVWLSRTAVWLSRRLAQQTARVLLLLL